MGDAAKSARIHNEKIRERRVGVTPALVGRDRTPGARIRVAF